MRALDRFSLLVGRGLVGWLVCIAGLAPVAGLAGDGRIELNQACAVSSGCTPTDAPGFPITLGTRGSYALTSDLEVPNENTNGIEISSDDVSIDFSGFTLFGAGTVPIATHVCSLPGTGTGILATGAAAGFVAQNGRVRGMGKDGIDVSWQNARIERMIVERNCGTAIRLGIAGLVMGSQARANFGSGIDVELGSRVLDSIAEQNGDWGIFAKAGSVITGCVATSNGNSGIAIYSSSGAAGGVAMGNVAVGNGGTAGILIPAGGVATHNSAVANAGGGISGGTTTGVGLNAAAGNGGAEISGTVIGCNANDGLPDCP